MRIRQLWGLIHDLHHALQTSTTARDIRRRIRTGFRQSLCHLNARQGVPVDSARVVKRTVLTFCRFLHEKN
jgi:hypothetical protein